MIDENQKLGARLWARPKRVAFLVDETFTDNDLNNLVRYCSRQLGGRLNPIVPISGHSLGHGWSELLASIDPDIVYSFQPIQDSLREELGRKIRPARFIEGHPAHRHDDGWQISESEIGSTQLTDVDLPFTSGTFNSPSVVEITLAERHQQASDSLNFCLRNFGAFSQEDWKNFDLAGKGLKIISVPEIGKTHEFLTSMMPQGGKLFPINVSSLGYEPNPFHWRRGNESQVYEIVIGDSLRDFLYVWNRSIITTFNWRKRALWVPLSSLESAEMIEACGNWARDLLIHDGDFQCKVLSYSVAEPQLKIFSEKIQTKACMRTTYAALEPDEACLSKDSSNWRCATKAARFEFKESDTAYGSPHPVLVPPEKLGRQGWVVEIEFDKPMAVQGAGFKNNSWHLPKRYRLDKKFVSQQQSSKITNSGHLAIEVSGDKRDFAITIPTPKQLCDILIREPRFSSNRKLSPAAGEFSRIETSSDGQFLWSVLSLFGGLEKASSFLEDEGWRNVMLDLIGEQNLQDEVDDVLVEFIKGQQTSTATDSRAKGRAKRQLVKTLVNMPSESRYAHLNHIANILIKAGSLSAEENIDPIRRKMHLFLSQGLFLQGAPIRCYICGSQRWHRVDDLKMTMTCQGCMADFSLPTVDSMTYRLNDLMLNGFRRFGFLPVFQALFALQRAARKHLLFLPQQNLFDWNTSEQVTDLDLVGILDERYFIGEVKTSEKGILTIDTQELERIVLELKPDILVIAAPKNAFTEKAQKHLTALLKNVQDAGIEPRVLPLVWSERTLPLSLVPPGTDDN